MTAVEGRAGTEADAARVGQAEVVQALHQAEAEDSHVNIVPPLD